MTTVCAYTETSRLLQHDFTIVDLGSANASTSRFLRPFLGSITLVELDALSDSQTKPADFYRHISIRAAVSGVPGKRLFYKRRFSQCSSFLNYKPEQVNSYGLEHLFAPDGTLELDCTTLKSILTEHDLKHIDFLKTDLEGIDYEVLSSAPDIVGQTLVVQAEVRFQPLYEGEPPFHIIDAFLTNLGFECIAFHPEIWKYPTIHQSIARDGRLNWADAIYFLNPQRVHEQFANQAKVAFIKQIIIARSLGLWNYAEHLAEQVKPLLSPAVKSELDQYLAPDDSLRTRLAIVAQALYRYRALRSVLIGCGRVFRLLGRVLVINPEHRHISIGC